MVARTGEMLTASSAEVDRFRTYVRRFTRNAERSVPASTLRRLAKRTNRMLGRPWLIYLAIAEGVRGVRRYGRAISTKHGVSKRDQFLRLSMDYYRNHTRLEDFYLYQFYLPERWASRARYFPLADSSYAEAFLIARLASPELEMLANKDKFAVACAERNLPTVPIVAEFLDGNPKGASTILPSADLFSKPGRAACGIGAQSWRYDPASDRFSNGGSVGLTKQGVIAALCEQSKLRKIIVQRTARNHPDMTSITNGALATIRIATCRAPSGAIDILPPIIRMPSGGGVVDNFDNNGMAAPLDRDSGVIIGPAIQRDPATVIRHLTVHPDTGVTLLDFAVPSWSEVVELALRAHQAFSTLLFIGWDIAVLQSGPVLVEANPTGVPDLVVLSHGISLSDTQFIPYFNRHWQQTSDDQPRR